MTTLSRPLPQDWWRPGAVPAVPAERATPEAGSDAALRGLMALTAIMFLAPQNIVPALASLRIALLAAIVTFAALARHRRAQGAPVFTLTPEMRWCLALVVWAIGTVPFSKWPGGSVNLLLDIYLKSVAVCWLLSNIVENGRALGRILWTLTLIAIPVAMTALYHLATGDYFPPTSGSERIMGYDAGLVKNPNDLALVLNLILPLTIALLLVERGRTRRALLAAIVCAEIGGVVATFSRSGFLTLAVIVAICLWRSRRHQAAIWVAAGLGLAVLALPLVSGSYVDRVSTILDKDADPTGSAQERWRDQVVAAGYVAEHPLIGAGVASDILVLNDLRGPKWRMVHDMYLELAVDLGLPGLAFFLTLFYKCFKAVSWARRQSTNRPGAEAVARFADGISISLTAFGVAAFFSPIAYHAYFYYLAGLAVASKAISQHSGGSA